MHEGCGVGGIFCVNSFCWPASPGAHTRASAWQGQCPRISNLTQTWCIAVLSSAKAWLETNWVSVREQAACPASCVHSSVDCSREPAFSLARPAPATRPQATHSRWLQRGHRQWVLKSPWWQRLQQRGMPGLSSVTAGPWPASRWAQARASRSLRSRRHSRSPRLLSRCLERPVLSLPSGPDPGPSSELELAAVSSSCCSSPPRGDLRTC